MLKFKSGLLNYITWGLLVVVIMEIVGLSMKGDLVYLEIYFSKINSLEFKFLFLVDKMSLMFLFTVSLITIAVLVFSSSYMSQDKFFSGFHFLVMVFVLSMFLLILSPSLLSGLLGWDGLGLSSYLLVIYYGSSKSYNSGMLTALTNRLGDGFMLLSISFFSVMGEWGLKTSSVQSMFLSWGCLMAVLISASTKSAQLPFCAWLPAAMAAPTPVSALVHSSTLVTAGVYLIIRHEYLLKDLGLAQVVLWVGLSSMLLSSVSALFERDMKKMVALSTLSQLGVMVVALGCGYPGVSFFHLVAHAFFKALLFISAGSLIHSSESYQDSGFMGGSAHSKPISGGFTYLAILSLSGLPFMSAFYSKELIFDLLAGGCLNLLGCVIFFMGALLTSLYSGRLMSMVFFEYEKGIVLRGKEDEDLCVLGAMLVLMPLGMFGGSGLNCFLDDSVPVVSGAEGSRLMLVTLVLFMFCVGGGIWKSGVLSQKSWGWGSLWGLPILSSEVLKNKPSIYWIRVLMGFDRGLIAIFTSKIWVVKKIHVSGSLFYFESQSKTISIIVLWVLLGLVIYY